MASLAEKFQITVPYSEKKVDKWVDFKSARCVEDNPDPSLQTKFNVTASTEIFEQFVENGGKMDRMNNFAQGFGGNTDASNGLGAKSLEQGFTRREMKATDDQYSGEHIDLFYGDAVDEKGNVGFVERNNYLDRS